jgi:hypothetical protein
MRNLFCISPGSTPAAQAASISLLTLAIRNSSGPCFMGFFAFARWYDDCENRSAPENEAERKLTPSRDLARGAFRAGNENALVGVATKKAQATI